MKEFFDMIWNGSPFWWIVGVIVLLAVILGIVFVASAVIVGIFRAIRNDHREMDRRMRR